MLNFATILVDSQSKIAKQTYITRKSLLVELTDRVNSDAVIHEKYPGLLHCDATGWELGALKAGPYADKAVAVGKADSTSQLIEKAVNSITKQDVQQVPLFISLLINYCLR